MDNTVFINNHLEAQAKECKNLKTTYLDKLAETKGDEAFKYLLLVNLVTCDAYITQSQLQAQQSFQLSRVVAAGGFILVTIGVAIAFSQMQGESVPAAALLSTIVGIITEFIAGVIFFLYNRTIRQVNLFHGQLQVVQKIVMSLMLNSFISSADQKDVKMGEIAAILINSIIENDSVPSLNGLSSTKETVSSS